MRELVYDRRMEGSYIPFELPYADNASSDDDELIGHGSFNYSHHGMDNTRESASYRDHPTVATLRMLSEVWLSMPIALFGIVGNLVSLVVLCYHKRLKKLRTVIIQLQSLAVVDTLILVTILLLRLIFTHFSLYVNYMFCPLYSTSPVSVCLSRISTTKDSLRKFNMNDEDVRLPYNWYIARGAIIH